MPADVRYPHSQVTLDLSDGAAEVDVTGWSVQRTISGSNLPGQVRAASGLATADGSVTFVVDDARTPWQAGPVIPGGAAAIDAVADRSAAVSPIARMLVRQISAAGALTPERTADLEEDLGGLRSKMMLPVTLGQDAGLMGTTTHIDAAWALDRAARVGGYCQTPQPSASALLCVHGAGSVVPEVGSIAMIPSATFRTATDGRAYVSYVAQYAAYGMSGAVGVGDTFYVTLTIPAVGATESQAQLAFGNALTGSYTRGLLLTLSGSTVRIVDSDTGLAVPGAVTYGRVQAQVQITSATSYQVRARSAYGGTWSSWIMGTIASTYSLDTSPFTYGWVLGPVAGLQVHTSDDPTVWAAPTAWIAVTGSPLTAVIPSGATTAWQLMQDVAASTVGTVGIDEAGVLRYTAKEALRGMVPAAGTIVADTDLADLPWGISSDDVADRVEVSYQPPDVQTSTTYTATVWEATDAVTVGAGKTVTLYADLDGAADQLAPWLPVWTTTPPATQRSRWAAATSRDGGGTQPADTALRVSATLVSPSRVRITITNTTAGTLYTVDGTGTPTLIIRAGLYATPGESVTISSGAPADTARNTLAVDLGTWVQDDDYAQAMLAWLVSMTAVPLPTLSQVQCVPDPTIRLGDVRILRDPRHTGLVSKVLVSGVSWTGAPGGLTQTLDLVVLDVIEWDIAQLWAGLATEADIASWITTDVGSAATETDLAALLVATIRDTY